MLSKIYHSVTNLHLKVRPDGTLASPIDSEHRWGIGCVARVILPPMGKCDGDVIDVKVDKFTTLPLRSKFRYNFQFPTNEESDKDLTVDSFDYEQCVFTDRDPSQRVTVTSKGIPVDMRGDMLVNMVVFHEYSGIDRSRGELEKWVRAEMQAYRAKMKKEDLDWQKRIRGTHR